MKTIGPIRKFVYNHLMDRKTISTIVIYAGGFSILNGFGNYFFKNRNINYLMFMLGIGAILVVIGVILKKKS